MVVVRIVGAWCWLEGRRWLGEESGELTRAYISCGGAVDAPEWLWLPRFSPSDDVTPSRFNHIPGSNHSGTPALGREAPTNGTPPHKAPAVPPPNRAWRELAYRHALHTPPNILETCFRPEQPQKQPLFSTHAHRFYLAAHRSGSPLVPWRQPVQPACFCPRLRRRLVTDIRIPAPMPATTTQQPSSLPRRRSTSCHRCR